MKNRKITRLLVIPVLVLISISFLVSPVAAVWGGSDTPSFATGGYDSTQNFFILSSDTTNGVCKIKCNNLNWPLAYPDGTTDWTYVGGQDTMTEDVTNNWYIAAEWTLYYELAAAWWGSITVEVWHVVREANGDWLWGYVVWDDECTAPGIFWTYESDTVEFDDSIGTGTNLDDDTTYRFCVELRVVVNNGGAVEAYYDGNDAYPVTLEVDSITWAYT